MVARAILRSLVEAATLAPSKLNTQPWKFALTDQGVRIFPDHARRLRVVDPEDRELFMSLGAAAENLMIAARHVGYAAALEVFPADEVDFCLRITLQPSDHVGDPLFAGLEARATNRRIYDARPLSDDEVWLLRTLPCEAGVEVGLVTDRSEMDALSGLVQRADVVQYSDPAFREELGTWVRFTAQESEHRHDGVPAELLGLHGHVPHWLGEVGLRVDARATKRAHSDAERIAGSAALAILSTATEGREAWVAAGRTLERLALTLALSGLACAHLDQPCEVPELRGLVREALELGPLFPQALLRVGHSTAAPGLRSSRRPLEEVVLPEELSPR